MKLVLKVAGNEVTTGSTSLENVYEESADYDKHKDKKKKKKKKEDRDRSNPGSPIDEKRKKKVIYPTYFKSIPFKVAPCLYVDWLDNCISS